MLVSSAEKGHFNPLVGPAQWLRRLGHDVGWLCVPETPAQIQSIDVEALRMPGHVEAPPLETSGRALAALVRDPDALRRWIRMLLLDGVPAQVDPVREVVRAWEPDVVALDGMVYQGVIAARLEGVPFAGVSSALTLLEPAGFDSDLLRTVRSLAADRARLFASYGLSESFRTCECLSPLGNFVFATASLVGDDAPLPPATALVGPSIAPAARGDETPFDWELLDPGKPLVYASFGSQIWYQPETFAQVAQAVQSLDAQLVLSAGGLAGSEWARALPGSPVVVRYAPQRELLARAAAFVTHGGANSVMEALSAAVPLLVLPVCNDQPLQAHYVTRAGAGLALAPHEVTREAIQDALGHLLRDDRVRARVATIAADYRAHDGARAAAERIARLAT